MMKYCKKIEKDDLRKEAKFELTFSVEPLTQEEIADARADDSLDTLFKVQQTHYDCLDTLERLFDHVSLCYENDINLDVLEWLKEFIEEEEKNAH